MLKLKHLKHPLRTVGAAQALLAAHWNMRRLAPIGGRRYKNDARYNLSSVTDGFASRLNRSADDTAILERICAAYGKAIERQSSVKQAHLATKWWRGIQETDLAPVQSALAARDINTLRAMYQNFFRDPCSGGLVAVPFGMKKAYSGQPVQDSYRRFFLNDALHRVDYWKAQTCNRFELRDLEGPDHRQSIRSGD